jgi:hypothetical protein
MDKNIIKETMLSLDGAAVQRAGEKHFHYVADTRVVRLKFTPPFDWQSTPH